MEYIIFEDQAYENFLPFTYTRFTGDMRLGILKLRQKIGLILNFTPNKIVIREELEDLYKERHPDWMINSFKSGDYLFINSRIKLTDEIASEIENLKPSESLVAQKIILAFRIKIDDNTQITTETLESAYINLPQIESKGSSPLWQYTWDFVHHNGEAIKEDFDLVFYEEDNFMEIDPGATAINPYQIWIGEGAKLKQGVILDATDGPIIIDEYATIMHNAVIIGPVYIGKKSIIKVSAKIYPNTSIGPNCKIGGEVEDTIIQAYTNKQHDGFLGHSYLGEWINIGADTNNSDLKNTYKSVKVYFYPEKRKINTNTLFIGTLIGDHSKIGINCSINTGTVIGFGVNIYGSHLINDFIESFSWGEANNLEKYQYEKFIETATIVKHRRKEYLSTHELFRIKQIYKKINE